MPELKIITSLKDGELASYLVPGQPEQEGMATIEVIGVLPKGMQSGAASVAMVIELPDGSRVIAETSWNAFSLGVVGLIGIWGTP